MDHQEQWWNWMEQVDTRTPEIYMTEENWKLTLKANRFLGVTGGGLITGPKTHKRRFRMDPPGHKSMLSFIMHCFQYSLNMLMTVLQIIKL